MADLDLLLDDLRRLVDVESPSLALDALAISAANLADLIEERTGRRPAIVESANGPHVWWQGSDDPAAKKVLILGHHDTVFPLGTLAERPFAVADGKATGPGVFDMKAGIVQALHAVASLDDVSAVEMLFTADEEIGSHASRQLLEDRAAACGAVLVLEPSAPGGSVKTGRKGVGTFEVTITGRASHAGLEPETGINALIEAAHQVLRIADLADPGRETTVTPTMATAGTAENVVPAEARIRVDARVLDPDEGVRIETAMYQLTPVDPEATITVTGTIKRPPMPPSASQALMPVLTQVAPDLDTRVVGGASDGNFTAAIGVPTLDGLGAIGGGAHADHEFVEIDTMVERVDLIARLLGALLA